ncbi:transposase [Escherichia coli]|nr:transposase [Escherichia coli]EFB2283393.1 transposase [Escherichia coli]EFC2186163.1 transposase [Escherichia coli]EFC2504532.1 transposase [Escherichia coli]EFH8674832.1 transposase [Escherichia coli]
MPDATQAVNRLRPALIVPQERLHHGFDIIYTLSTHYQLFTFVRLFEPCLIGSRPTFSHLPLSQIEGSAESAVVRPCR